MKCTSVTVRREPYDAAWVDRLVDAYEALAGPLPAPEPTAATTAQPAPAATTATK